MNIKGKLKISMLLLALLVTSSAAFSAHVWYRDGGWHGGGWYGGAAVYDPPLYYNSSCDTIRVCNPYGNCWLEQTCY